MNPLTIALLRTAGIIGYVCAGIGTYKFLYYVREWQNSSEDDERVVCCCFWPITMLWFAGLYFIRAIIWLIRLPFRPFQVRAARVKRSGKNWKGQIVK
jgi:hypothetical protein